MLNKAHYRSLLDKYQNVHTLPAELSDKCSFLTLQIILQRYRNNLPVHINFQNCKDLLFPIGRHLFIELANDIYTNHYDLPDQYTVGEKLKRIIDNEYYIITKAENNTFRLKQLPRKNKNDTFTTEIPSISYDKLCTGFLKVNSGISDSTIRNYFNFFKTLNTETSDFPHIYFEKKSIFIAKKWFWDDLEVKSKIPSAYLPNPREENDQHSVKSIQGLPDPIIYFSPKYDVCYSKLNTLFQARKVHTIIVYDTEAENIPQIVQDKNRFGFNLIILSNAPAPIRNVHVPCWNWFKEEIEMINSI